MLTAEAPSEVLSGVEEMRRYLKSRGIGVGATWLYTACQDQQIPAVKVAGQWRITPAKLREALGLPTLQSGGAA
jgi:hypothetical protein